MKAPVSLFSFQLATLSNLFFLIYWIIHEIVVAFQQNLFRWSRQNWLKTLLLCEFVSRSGRVPHITPEEFENAALFLRTLLDRQAYKDFV